MVRIHADREILVAHVFSHKRTELRRLKRGNNEVVLRRGPRKQDLWRKRTIWHCTASQLE